MNWDMQPFQIHYDEAAMHIRGIFQTAFWEKLASPQMCEQDFFVRHGIIAIGILSQLSPKENYIDPDLQDPQQSRKTSGYSYALNHYDKALQGMREAIANGQNDIRKALIACLIVFCFESLQGNQDSAIMQARSGLVLLDDWIRCKRAASSSDTNDDGIMGQDLMDAFAALESRVSLASDERSEELLHAHWNEYESSCSELSYH